MTLSKVCFFGGIISIPLSVLIWFMAPNLSGPQFSDIADTAMRLALESAHSERWGIFVGLWPATLLILSDILGRKN